MSDIRINGNFRSNRKRKRLEQLAGAKAVVCLINLWIAAAEHRPRGVLQGWDAVDVALEAEWDGDPERFVTALVSCALLDVLDDGTYAIHDWESNQPYAYHKPERVAQSKKAIAARWKNRAPSSKNTDSIPAVSDEQSGENTGSNTPIPTPIPIPTPNSICSELETTSEPPVCVIPLIKRDGEFAVTAAMVAEWQESFPGVDVRAVLRHLVQWNRDHPKKRKTRRGVAAHVSGWLGREQDKAGARGVTGGGDHDRPVL